MSGVPTSLRLSCIPPENASITCSGHHSILQSEGAIDEDVLDPDRGLARIFIGGPGGDRIRVEDDDVSLVPGSDLPAVVKPESLSRGERHVPDRLGKIENTLVADVGVQNAWERPPRARMGPVTDEDAVTDRKSTRLNSSHVAISYAV